MDKDFFCDKQDAWKPPSSPFFCSTRGRRSSVPTAHLQPPRAGAVKAGRSSAVTVRLGLDRPEHGGMLDGRDWKDPMTGRDRRSPARLELAGTGDYCCRARATSWRRAMRRLQASPGSLICVLPS